MLQINDERFCGCGFEVLGFLDFAPLCFCTFALLCHCSFSFLQFIGFKILQICDVVLFEYFGFVVLSFVVLQNCCVTIL